MRLLLPLLRPMAWLTSLAVLASLASGVLSMLLITLINRALTASTGELPRLGVLFAGTSVCALAARWLSEDFFARIGQGGLAALRVRLARRIEGAPLASLESSGPPRVLAVLAEDVSTIAHFLNVLPGLLMHGAMVLGCLVYLGALSARLFMLVGGFVLVGSLSYLLAEGWALARLRSARSLEDRVFAHFRSLFDGAKELRLHRPRAEAFLAQIESDIAAVFRLKTAGLRISVGASSAGSFLFFAVIGAILFVAGGAMQLEPGVVSGYALVFLYMVLPLESLLGAIPALHQTRISATHLGGLLAGLPPEERGELSSVPSLHGSSAPEGAAISLRQVTHRYRRERDDEVFEVGPIDLELRPGELVFLVGGNGSGKTTLAKLLVGLYPPEHGQITLNCRPVTDENRGTYRACFSAVFADFHLFDSILGLDPGRVAREAPALLARLDLAHKVTVEQGRFSTLALSQGQRKRLALVVAWLEERPAYVFDEWAADQDPAYKETFYRVFLPELKARGKTVFVITHDDRYFSIADRVLKLDAGRFVAALPTPGGAAGDDGARVAAHLTVAAHAGMEES